MTTPSGPSKKDDPGALPVALEGIDRLFGRDLRSKGWVVDLSRAGVSAAARGELHNRMDDKPDPAIIWVMRGRRR